jgi:hypothetical protein
MLKLLFGRSVRVTVLTGSSMETQHGVALVRSDQGLTSVGIAVDRPEVLEELTPEAVADMFEQIGNQGYIPQSIEIATRGNRKHFEKI